MAVAEPRTPELGKWHSTADGEPFGEWELPGMGEDGPRCGQVSAAGMCTEGHVNYQKHLCGRRECPTCWSSQWAGPRTVNVVSRLTAARYAEEPGLDRRVVHAVVSPPEDTVNTIEAFYGGRTDALDIAKEHGIRGGVVIAHGYRPLDETQKRYREEDPDLPIWWWIRENDRQWQEQVYWSPHYHVIGLSRDLEAGDRSDGWVIQNFSTGEGVEPNPQADRTFSPLGGLRDRNAIEDVVGVVRYTLSHATFPADQDRQAVTWFGSLHGTNFKPEEAISEGAYSVIQRVTEDVVGSESDNDESDGGPEEEDRCDHEECEEPVIDAFDLRDYLDQYPDTWDPPTRARARAIYDWRTGKREPPPGMKNPTDQEQAEEVLDKMTV